ncbi:hypothetical protein TREMEDRAFT_67926 [Tremella mesenterica DSM 1558]|uniref:uncharacterized protein n=1 Tax=Tremella mesenterica (strain ATCC 24925 / CBS 8224 / DSM 1558 / NBRC 9311 / NRRL Y-6157 / RJB 2259-6 / UBC 559-6) TaxID=578456 RepID=UPI0003F49C87|nr:uncharacterized protein TREMEDRAFT_67926 [Tremella mesenterica DSM 1558]EIW71721.1 hypothetical protein TREMEDRAFT_67926 [Tremella mesenterica DSM 1558]
MVSPQFEYPSPPLWLTIADYAFIGMLETTVLFSLGILLLAWFRKRRQGELRLPDKAEPPLPKIKQFEALLVSHVDPSLQHDGDPIDLPGFWRKVTFAKLIIDTVTITYLLSLSTCFVLTKSVKHHDSLTKHLSTIITIHLITWYMFTLGQALSLLPTAPSHWTEHLALLLSFLQLCVAILIPIGPNLNQDMTKLYNKALSAKLKDANMPYAANVIQSVSSTILGQVMFTFVFPMVMKTAKKEQVDVDDLPILPAHMRTQNVLPEVAKVTVPEWVQRRGPTSELMWMVWAPRRWQLTKYFALAFAIVPMWYAPHWATQKILEILDSDLPRVNAVAFGVLLVLVRIAALICLLQQYNIATFGVEPQISAHTAFLLYQKLLTRNTLAAAPVDPKGKEKIATTKADILNLISSDSSRLASLGWTFVSTLETCLEMFLGCFYVWMLLGMSGLWGLSTIVVTLPPAYLVTKYQYKVFEKRLEVKDEKITLMQEAIQAISMIKMMAAERWWFRRIKTVRDREFTRWIQARLLGFLSALLYSVTPVIVVVVAFAHYTLVAKKDLTAAVAFTSIAVFAELRPVLYNLPMNMAQILQEILSAKRIGTFLRTRDVDYLEGTSSSYASAHLGDENESSSTEDRDLYIIGTVGWDVDHPSQSQPSSDSQNGSTAPTPAVKFRLHDLNLHFTRGEITLVAGKVGSGKTMLLLALLGEAKLLSGKINYAVSPILNPLNASRVDVTTLAKRGVAFVPQTPWLQSLSIRDNILFGLPMDMTRYREVLFATGLMPDLELLEDADLTEIGERGKILSGGQKARVSLARAVYSRASVLLLDDVISAVDAETSQHIVNHCFRGRLMTGRTVIIASHAVEALAPLAHRAIFLDDGQVIWSGAGPDLLTSNHMAHLTSDKITSSADTSAPINMERRGSLADVEKSTFEIKEATPKTPRQLIIEEKQAKGSVELKHWKQLMRFNGGGGFWAGMIALVVMGCLAPVAERGIHAAMLDSLLRARMLFFTKTRAGSIVQRFGTDLDDTVYCSELLAEMLEIMLTIVISLASVSYYGGWLFLVISISLIAAIWRPGQWYRSSSRQVRRLQAVIPGPINAIYGETVAGTAVIRAFGQQSVFMEELMRSINMRIAAKAWASYIQRWLFINLRVMDIVIVFTAFVLILSQPNMTGATAGFVLGFARNITTNVNWALINLRTFELKGVSLERTAEYRELEKEDTEPLGVEGSDDIAGYKDVPEDWPRTGDIEVKDLCARYGPDLPEILHGVSFDVKGGERVGIVGATGGGKSTLAKAFFSFVDVIKGVILIDGLDISTIPLGAVRSSLGIIAQDPILLSGSLRLNLDIEGKYDDVELYEALRQVQLLKEDEQTRPPTPNSEQTVVEVQSTNIFSNLDTEIKSGGENLSAGQKQLVVLARALLKKHKILILDEATASIDSATDKEVSRVVHDEFKGATVLIIAHRLRYSKSTSKSRGRVRVRVLSSGYMKDCKESKMKDIEGKSGMNNVKMMQDMSVYCQSDAIKCVI